MNHQTFNRVLAITVIGGCLTASLVGGSATTPSQTADVLPAGAFSIDPTATQATTAHSSVVAEAVSMQGNAEAEVERINEVIEEQDLGKAEEPSEDMVSTREALDEVVSSYDIKGIVRGAEALLFTNPSFVRASSTASSTSVESHISTEVAEGYFQNVDGDVAEWKASVETAYNEWVEAIDAENARIEEEERRAAEEARRQAEARAAAEREAAAQRAAAQSSNAPSSSSGAASTSSAPVRNGGESATQRVQRLQRFLGVSVPFTFQECNIARAMGCYTPGHSSIWITNLGLSKNDRTLCMIILHEYRHVQQHQQGLIKFNSDYTAYSNTAWLESDATAYANRNNRC